MVRNFLSERAVSTRFAFVVSAAPALLPGALFLLGVALYFDIGRPFTWSPGPDVVSVYNALLLGDGIPHILHDHPGYIYYLALAGWYKALKFVGLISVAALSDLPGPKTFEPHYATLVVAGRWLHLLLAVAFGAVFHGVVRHISRNAAVAAVATFLLMVSPGTVVQSMILRTDMVATMFALLAFLLLISAARVQGVSGLVRIFGAGALCVLALLTKVQVFPILLALPVLAIAFGERARPTWHPVAGPLNGYLSPEATLGVTMGGAALFLPALAVIAARIWMVDGTGLYQAATAVYIAALTFFYGRFYGYEARQSLAALAALSGGMAVGLATTMFSDDPVNVHAVANVIEHMARLSAYADSLGTGTEATTSRLELARDMAARSLSFVGKTLIKADLTVASLQALYGFVLCGMVWAGIAGRYRAAFQAMLLLGVAFGMQWFSSLKYFVPIYFVFVAPWAIAAGAVLLTGRRDAAGSEGGEEGTRRKTPAVVAFGLLGALVVGAVSIAYDLDDPYLAGGTTARTPAPLSYTCKKGVWYLHRIPEHVKTWCERP